jgi:PilZ domain
MRFVPAKAPRRSAREWIAIPVRINAGGSRVDGVTINVSEHGMYVFAAASLAVGTEIEIAYCPPSGKKTVYVCGIVRRRAVFLYGIEFLDADTPPVGIPRYIHDELS